MRRYKVYKNAIDMIVGEALLNYITGGLASEVDFRMWLSERRFYYKNRIVNTIVPRKLDDKLEIIAVIQQEVDKIKETVYDKRFDNVRELYNANK